MPEGTTELTDRDREYVVLVCRYPKPSLGDIAENMRVSESTVRKHADNVHKKWGIHCFEDLYEMAVRKGIVKCICQRIREEEEAKRRRQEEGKGMEE